MMRLLIWSSIGPFSITILSRKRREYMSKERSPREVFSITMGMSAYPLDCSGRNNEVALFKSAIFASTCNLSLIRHTQSGAAVIACCRYPSGIILLTDTCFFVPMTSIISMIASSTSSVVVAPLASGVRFSRIPAAERS